MPLYVKHHIVLKVNQVQQMGGAIVIIAIHFKKKDFTFLEPT